jgi:hypothetical protein
MIDVRKISTGTDSTWEGLNYQDSYTRQSIITDLKEAIKIEEVFSRDPVVLRANFVIDASISYNLIKYTEDKNYVYEGVTLVKTKDEVKTNLKSTQYGEVFFKLNNIISEKYKIKE